MKYFVLIQIYSSIPSDIYGAYPETDVELLKLRPLWVWESAEIAEKLGLSKQVIGYHLKKLKKQSKEKGADEVFLIPALMAGFAGAALELPFSHYLSY
ncbi:MAG: hypothetical protein CM15mP3_09900 [Candidatus Poseidoniales archaeon]|nr:MAG: hypothetical protein CM15mP3_09900 [Candidatus Poseidoniales archaeon]